LQAQNFTIELQRTGASYVRSALAKYAAGDVTEAVSEYRKAIGRDADLASPTPISLGKHSAAVRALLISADGNWLASASDDGTCRVWQLGDTPQSEAVVLDNHGGEPLECLAIDSGSRWLATGGWDDRVVMRSLRADALTTLTAVAEHGGDVLEAAFSADGKWLVSASLDAKLRLWPLEKDSVLPDPTILLLGEKENDDVDCEMFALSHDGRWLVAIDVAHGLHRWDLLAADISGSRKLLASPGFRVKRCMVRPSTTELIMVGEAGAAAVLDFGADSGLPVALAGGADDFESLAMDAAGETLLAGTSSGLLHCWRRQDGQFEAAFRLDKHIKPVVDIAVTADGAWALSGGWDKTAFLWYLSDAESAASPLQMSGHGKRLHAVVIDPVGRWCATGSEDGEVLLWDLPRCQLIQRATEGLQPHGDPRMAWLPSLQRR
jgi:WD40 repeat protein